jgi:hypothetical protein
MSLFARQRLATQYPTLPRTTRLFEPEFLGPVIIAWAILLWVSSLAVGVPWALALLVLSAYGLAVLGLRWPAAGLFGVSILCTTDAIARSLLLSGGLLPLPWNTFNYWLLLVAILFFPLLLRLTNPHVLLLGLFALLLILQLLYTTDMEDAQQHVLGLLITFGLLIYFARSSKDDNIWYWNGLICGVIGAVGGLLFIRELDSLPYINPNAWAYFPLTAIFAITFAIVVSKGRTYGQLALLLLASVNAGWVFLSASRGSMLITLCALLFIIVVTRNFWFVLLVLCVALVMVSVIASQFDDEQAYAIGRLTSLFDSDRSLSNRTSGRSDLALGSWLIFKDNPFGIGTGNFASGWANLGLRSELSTFGVGRGVEAHSGWGKTLAENGIPGILLHVGFVVSFALVGLTRRTYTLRYLGLLVTFSLAGAFLSTEFQNKGLWFLSAGAIVLINREHVIAQLAGYRRRMAIDNMFHSPGVSSHDRSY